jgi:hypothetical protein
VGLQTPEPSPWISLSLDQPLPESASPWISLWQAVIKIAVFFLHLLCYIMYIKEILRIKASCLVHPAVFNTATLINVCIVSLHKNSARKRLP